MDTNVWVSALEFGGTPARALFQALTRDQLAVSDFIEAEVWRVLTRKFARDPEQLRAQLDELLVQAIRIEVTGEMRGACRDPKDDAILETAWKARATLLIAGDRDLLSLGSFRITTIVTPSAYLETH